LHRHRAVAHDSSSQRLADALEGPASPAPRRHRSGVITNGAAARVNDEVLVYRSDRGELRLRLAAADVVVLVYAGYTEVGCVDALARTFDAIVGDRSGIHLFVDCEEQTGYDMAFPSRIAEWTQAIQPRLGPVCLLVRSRIVAFGVAVVNVLTGAHATTVTTREGFLARLATSIRQSPNGAA
jgi:hypothetical protein